MFPVEINGQPAVMVSVPSITWRNASLQQDDQATVFVHRGSSAFTRTHLGATERKAIEIKIHTPWGNWGGIVTGTSWSRKGVTLDCAGYSRLLSTEPQRRPGFGTTTNNGIYLGQMAGAIVRDIVVNGIVQRASAGFIPGSFALSPPIVEEYDLSTAKVPRTVFNELYDITGQELKITSERVISWVPAAAPLYATTLIDGVHVIVEGRKVDTNDQVFKINSVDDDGNTVLTTYDPTIVGPWMRTVERTSQQPTVALRAFELSSEIIDLAQPSNVYSLGLVNTGTLWYDIREGMAISILCPGFGFVDCDVVVRVLSRTYNEGNPLMTLEVQYLMKPEQSGNVFTGIQIPKVVRASKTDAFRRVYNIGFNPLTLPVSFAVPDITE